MNIRKLKKIVQEKVGNYPKVNISLSTIEQADDVNGVVIFNDKNADIIINGNNCKTDKQVIRAVAHETAHIVLKNNEHNNNHTMLWDEIDKEFNIAYLA